METPICISYIRFSSSSQADGASYDRQLDAAKEYADRHGMVLDDKYRYEDLGVSAYTGKHVKSGHLRAFLDCVDRSEIPAGSVLIIEHLDRLSRENPLDAFEIFHSIVKKGIKIVTLMDGVEYTKDSLATDFGKLLVMMVHMQKAHDEINTRRVRILNGFAKKRANLHKEKFTANCPTWLKLDKGTNAFEVIPDRAEIVKRIFQMSFDGLGIKAIGRILNQEGVLPPRAKSWGPSSIRKLLSSRAVIGVFQPCIYNSETKKYIPQGEPVPDYFPRILEDDIFFAVQARLSNGTHISGKTAKVENLFSGITKCGYCGARMDVRTLHNKKEIARYLVCDQARRGVKCSYVSIKCNEVERAFLTYCQDIDIINVLKREGNKDQLRLAELRKQIAAKNGELLDVSRQQDLLDNELPQVSNQLELGYFRKRLSALLQQEATIKAAIAEMERETIQLSASLRDAKSKVTSILTLLDHFNSTFTEQERISVRTRLRNEIRQIVKQVAVFPLGRFATDEMIATATQEFDEMIEGAADETAADTLRGEKDLVLAQMRRSQENTKDDRFFTVLFKNGNSRHFKYSKEEGSYKVSFDRVGNRIEWQMRGNDMKPIILEEDDQLPTAEEAMQG